MSTDPLTRTLDVRKAAARGATVSGSLNPAKLSRLRDLLAGETGEILAKFAFFRDEQARPVVRIAVRAGLSVTCQRCLQPMAVTLDSDNTLAIVWTDEQARLLPRTLEPLVVAGEDECDLWELVEEELMLALPAFSYHEAENCNELLTALAAADPPEEEQVPRPNPFDVLATLKAGDKTRSE